VAIYFPGIKLEELKKIMEKHCQVAGDTMV
jgi:hypothetical protein